VAVNSAESIAQLKDIIEQFFAGAPVVHDSTGATQGIASRFFTVAN